MVPIPPWFSRANCRDFQGQWLGGKGTKAYSFLWFLEYLNDFMPFEIVAMRVGSHFEKHNKVELLYSHKMADRKVSFRDTGSLYGFPDEMICSTLAPLDAGWILKLYGS